MRKNIWPKIVMRKNAEDKDYLRNKQNVNTFSQATGSVQPDLK